MEITKDQIGVPLPELVGAKPEKLILDGKEYDKTAERWGKAFYRNKKVCLLVDLETGEIHKTIPSEQSFLRMGVILLKGVVSGELDAGDVPVTQNTVKELMKNYSADEKQAIWSQLTPEEKEYLKNLPKDPIRVEKNILYVDQDLPTTLTKIPEMDFTDDIKSVVYKGETYNFFIRMGDVLEFSDETRTKTLMVDVYTNALCLTEFISPPLKKSKDGVEMWIGNTPYQLSHRHYNRLPVGFGQMSQDERIEVIADMQEQDRLILEAQELERKRKEVWESAGKKPKASPKKKLVPKEVTPELFSI